MVAHCGQCTLLGKCNIKSAFSFLPIFLGDFEFFGFGFKSSIYVDTGLPMGCSILCLAFEELNMF